MARKDEVRLALVHASDQHRLAQWAIDCAERVLPYVADHYPQDPRPRHAIDTLTSCLATGVLQMAVSRKASRDAHVAARDVGTDSPARSAARAAGHAVATAHVARHGYGPAIYGQQAIVRATYALEAVEQERNWQYHHVLGLANRQTS